MNEQTFLRMHVEKIGNHTWHARVIEIINGTSTNGSAPNEKVYDAQGALYYVVAVVFFYGISIILMIGSQALKKNSDGGIAKYMEEKDKVRLSERRHAKFKTRVAMMQNKQISHILGRRSSDVSGESRLAMLRKKEEIVSLARSSSERSYDKTFNKTRYKSMDLVSLHVKQADDLKCSMLSPLPRAGGNLEVTFRNDCHSNLENMSPCTFLPAVTKVVGDECVSPKQEIKTAAVEITMNNDDSEIPDGFLSDNDGLNCGAMIQSNDKMIHIPLDTLPEEEEEHQPIYV